MATFKNQVSAFIFKNFALSRRRRGSQIGLLFVFQILLLLGAVTNRLSSLKGEVHFGGEGPADLKTQLKRAKARPGEHPNSFVSQDLNHLDRRYKDSI